MLDKKIKVLLFLAALQAALFTIAPMLSVKTGTVFGVKFLTGTALFGVCYIINDLINNNWGKGLARTVITISCLVRMAIYLVVIPTIISIPTAAAPLNYKVFVLSAWWIFLAGEISMWTTQYFLEIPFFSWIRQIFGFGNSYILSGILNTAISALLFSIIAFWGASKLGTLILGQWVFSVGIRVVSLPIAVVANKLLLKIAPRNVVCYLYVYMH